LTHPEVGLRREKLPIGDSGGQVLVIYHAESGSDSARALDRLRGLAALPGLPPAAHDLPSGCDDPRWIRP